MFTKLNRWERKSVFIAFNLFKWQNKTNLRVFSRVLVIINDLMIIIIIVYFSGHSCLDRGGPVVPGEHPFGVLEDPAVAAGRGVLR